MTMDWGRWAGWAAAITTAGVIFTIDCIAGFDVSISILYILALGLVALRGTDRDVVHAAIAAIGLSVISWLVVHGLEPFDPSALRLVFAGTAITVTAGLLVSRKHLTATRRLLEESRAELEDSRAELLHFVDSVPHILWRASPQAEVDFYNGRYAEVIGRDSRETMARQDWLLDFHPDDREPYMAEVQAAFTAGTELDATYRLRHASGDYRWTSVQGRPKLDEAGNVTRYYGGTTDVHDAMLVREELKRTRVALEELNDTLERRVEERTADLIRTEARYSSLFEVSNMTFAEMDFSATEPILDRLRTEGVTDLAAYMTAHPDTLAATLSLIRTTRVNEALARLMGYESVAELVANPPAQNAEDGAAVLLRQLEMYYTGAVHIDGRTVLVGKDGITIPVYFTVNRLADGLHLSSHLDLTEQERIEEMRDAAQEELARANRIATVGAFSASIAHELNQPIASMVMDAQTGLRFLQREAPDLPAAERILQRLTRTAQRVADIVQHTRDSIVGGTRVARTVDLCALAAETTDLLERDLRRAEATLEMELHAEIAEVLGDPVQLQQVLVNLITNAAEAMRDTAGERRITLSVDVGPTEVEVSVADTGPGISAEALDRLFLPFFTTKTKGVGMGLQICRSAIEGMGGTLSVCNRDAGGAAFTFRLPVAGAIATDA